MRFLLGALLILMFFAGGGVAAYFMRGPAEPVTAIEPDPYAEPLPEPEFIAFPREFIVPLMSEGKVRAHVVLTLGLQSETVPSEILLEREPVLRDRLLEALFMHATIGGFEGRFTDISQMNRLRASLNEAISVAFHPAKATVLVTSMDRRDR